ncbi:MAG TPA: hypothetical protein VJQ85_05025 [Gaiellaceae bacterium]|nr:hypothetical protein [Gaiellaceae bacterium]
MLPSRSCPPSVGVNPTNHSPGRAGSPSVFTGRPRGPSTPRWPTSESRPARKPVAAMSASGVRRDPSARTTSPPSKRSTAATISTRRCLTADTIPTSRIGVVPVVMNAVRTPWSGRGSPCALRSGIDSLRCAFVSGSTQWGGSLRMPIPISCAGIPAVARRTICGGVRTDSRLREAPPSATSVAISAPEFPAPTTRTSRPRYGAGFRYCDEWISSPANPSRPGQSGMNGAPL